MTSKKRNHESTNPVFTNLKCFKMSFLLKIKYYYNDGFLYILLKSKALPLATLPKKTITKKRENRIRRFVFCDQLLNLIILPAVARL